MSVSHNVTRRNPEHDPERVNARYASVMSASHNLSRGSLPRHITPETSTDVRIAAGPWGDLRKRSLEAAAWRGEPLDTAVGLAPALLERLLILRGDVGQVQGATVSEVNAGVHGGGVYTRG